MTKKQVNANKEIRLLDELLCIFTEYYFGRYYINWNLTKLILKTEKEISDNILNIFRHNKKYLQQLSS